MFNFYHERDPNAPAPNHCWHWVYLHGQAEYHMETVQREKGWGWAAPDLFVCDQPMPTEPGHYEAMLYGRRVVVVLAAPERYKSLGKPCGRAAFPEDEAGFRHASTPEDWR